MNQELQFIQDFRLLSLNELVFEIKSEPTHCIEKLNEIEYINRLGFDIKIMHQVAHELLKIGVYLSVEFFDENNRPLNIEGNFIYESIYKIDGLGTQLPNITNKDALSQSEIELLLKLCNLTIGTVRGVLHEKLKSTIMEGFIFPFITDKTIINIIKDKSEA